MCKFSTEAIAQLLIVITLLSSTKQSLLSDYLQFVQVLLVALRFADRLHGLCEFQKPICQCALAVIHVRDDTEVAHPLATEGLRVHLQLIAMGQGKHRKKQKTRRQIDGRCRSQVYSLDGRTVKTCGITRR